MKGISAAALSGSLIVLAACSRDDAPAPVQAERMALSDVGNGAPSSTPETLPDLTDARWSVDESGQAIHFGLPSGKPLLTLDCRLDTTPPEMHIIRHAGTRPGMKALFPVQGNGVRSRFLADAALGPGANGGEWRWDAVVPADDPMLEVFSGPRELKATMPGAGMLEIPGSRIPGEFVTWCRAGGSVMQVEAEEVAEEADEADLAKSAQRD